VDFTTESGANLRVASASAIDISYHPEVFPGQRQFEIHKSEALFRAGSVYHKNRRRNKLASTRLGG